MHRPDLWFLPRAFFSHGAMGVGQAPGLPCALCFSRDVASGKTRARCVAGMRRCVSLSLRAKRSNPECVRGKILDCFGRRACHRARRRRDPAAPRNDGVCRRRVRGCLIVESEAGYLSARTRWRERARLPSLYGVETSDARSEGVGVPAKTARVDPHPWPPCKREGAHCRCGATIGTLRLWSA